MERPQAEWLIEFLEKAGKLKSVPRHCITPEGVRETVAGHCWRVSLMAWLLKEELPDVDMEKVIHMCLLHDLGEAVTGDIPAFEKKEQDRSVERKAVGGLLSMLPGKTGEEAKVLFAEMNALETDEAKVYKALDKLEAVIAHNESDISTWLPLTLSAADLCSGKRQGLSDFGGNSEAGSRKDAGKNRGRKSGEESG